jgi:hypothetical protein
MDFVKKPFPNKGLPYPKLTEKAPFQTLAEVEARIKRGGLAAAEQADLWECVFLTLANLNELLNAAKKRSLQPSIYLMLFFAAHTVR